MEPRQAARMMSIGRVAIGAALMAAPGLATSTWIGKRGLTPGADVFARALGARDLGIGVAVLAALGGQGSLRVSLAAGVLADTTDLLATIAQRDGLPVTAVPLLLATAGPGMAIGAYALAGTDDGAPQPVPA
jgi:hypothetical protein